MENMEQSMPGANRQMDPETDHVHAWLHVRDEEGSQTSMMEEQMHKQLLAERERLDALQVARGTVTDAFEAALGSVHMRISALEAALNQYPERPKAVKSDPPIYPR